MKTKKFAKINLVASCIVLLSMLFLPFITKGRGASMSYLELMNQYMDVSEEDGFGLAFIMLAVVVSIILGIVVLTNQNKTYRGGIIASSVVASVLFLLKFREFFGERGVEVGYYVCLLGMLVMLVTAFMHKKSPEQVDA